MADMRTALRTIFRPIFAAWTCKVVVDGNCDHDPHANPALPMGTARLNPAIVIHDLTLMGYASNNSTGPFCRAPLHGLSDRIIPFGVIEQIAGMSSAFTAVQHLSDLAASLSRYPKRPFLPSAFSMIRSMAWLIGPFRSMS